MAVPRGTSVTTGVTAGKQKYGVAPVPYNNPSRDVAKRKWKPVANHLGLARV